MHRVGSWLQTKKVHASASTQSLDALAESQNLEAALRAATLIMNDDVDGAERGLDQGNSSFHKLGKGVVYFLKAALGFEQDIMKEASQVLADAETTATNDQSRAQRGGRAFHSDIYAAGSEFALCGAQAQIMGAVVAVLNESLTESIRGFYKLRKAYATLDSLMEMEGKFVKMKGGLAGSRKQSSESLRSNLSTGSDQEVPGGFNQARTHDTSEVHGHSALRQAANADDDDVAKAGDDDSDDFYDADERADEHPMTRRYTGNLELPNSKQTDTASPIDSPFSKISLDNRNGFEKTNSTDSSSSLPLRSPTHNTTFTFDPDSEVLSNPLDVFIHSGASLCFGLLLVLISAIPPAFGKLLYIIGFRGDRERGLRMLWQASKFGNINGGMAGLILLGWYNGLVGFCDIIPDSTTGVEGGEDDVEGYPTVRLRALLKQMRERYPDSRLWLMEEARMAAAQRRLDETLRLLNLGGESKLKQLEALHWFEKSMNSMYAHRYELCSSSLLKCVDLNSWSRALYYYIAGAAHLALYRNLKDSGKAEDRKEAAKQAKLAEEYFKVSTTHTGKKKMMGRQLPFDLFVTRKIAKWTARSAAWGCAFVDAVGVSPIEEMTFFWNGYKKMDLGHLEDSLTNLAWSEDPSRNPHWTREDLDEKAILALLRAVVLRNMRRNEEAKALLRKQIIAHEAHLFKGHHKDDWTAPVAHYEMAVNLWMEREEYIRRYGAGLAGANPQAQEDARDKRNDRSDQSLVAEAKEWIEKAKNWGGYEMDARIGMKVTTGVDAIKKWEATYSAAGPRQR